MQTVATILLVEDDESLQEGIHDLLELADCGYEIQVLTASDGQMGLEMMRTVTPDLIISDIMMPHMDGLEFLREVRQVSQWAHVPFVFLTAKGKKQDMRLGRSSGAELYITKPFDSKELIDLVKTQLDRSFQRQAAQQAHLHNFKRSVLQLLNHEFRTPLTYVTAYYEMLTDSLVVYEDMENLDAYLKGILSGCVRLSKLVDSLILVMGIRTGEVAAQFKEQAQVVENVGELLRAVGEERTAVAPGITFAYEGLSQLPPIWGVPQQLQVVFNQLVDNAVKFLTYKMESPKIITLAGHVVGDELLLSVHDNGIGIPEQVQGQIFGLFYQYNRDYMEQQGSGAGLTIAKGLVNVHQGYIQVESKEGVESRFTIHLPLHVGMETAVNQPIIKPKAHVLVVEDDQYLLDGLQELLEFYDGPYDLHVSTAINGLAGLDAVMRYQPDLIISDIMMPKMDGFEFLNEVRSHTDWLQIPFIFLTAKGEATDVHKGRQSGVEEYITKPYDSDELLELVTIQLNRYFQLLDLAQGGFEELKQSILQLLQADFRTPLHSVTSYSTSLSAELQEAETVDDLKRSLTGIQQGSQQLSAMIENFIMLAEMKTGEAQNAFDVRAIPQHNLASLVELAVMNTQLDGWPPEIKLEWHHTNGQPAPILVDQESLLHGLDRLLDAGRRACVEYNGRQLSLELSHAANQFHLRMVRDGQPYTADHAAQINQLFMAQDERLIDQVSDGPSLCIVQGIVRLHNGRMELENTAEQVALIIHLPFYEDSETLFMT